MNTLTATPLEASVYDVATKSDELIAQGFGWADALPEEIRTRASNHPAFVYPPENDRKSQDMEEDLGVLPVGAWNALLLLAAERGIYPNPEMLEVFRPLGRPGMFWFLDLYCVHVAFPGNEALIVDGLLFWINAYRADLVGFADTASHIRANCSGLRYFLDVAFAMAPAVLKNPAALAAAESVARLENRVDEFNATFKPMA